MAIDSTQHKRPVRSYVIRSGRLTDSQRKAIDEHWHKHVFAFEGKKPSEDDKKAYIELLQEAINRNIPLKGVYLYGVERPSLLPESANKISKLPEDWLISFAEQIRNIGISVKVSA